MLLKNKQLFGAVSEKQDMADIKTLISKITADHSVSHVEAQALTRALFADGVIDAAEKKALIDFYYQVNASPHISFKDKDDRNFFTSVLREGFFSTWPAVYSGDRRDFKALSNTLLGHEEDPSYYRIARDRLLLDVSSRRMDRGSLDAAVSDLDLMDQLSTLMLENPLDIALQSELRKLLPCLDEVFGPKQESHFLQDMGVQQKVAALVTQLHETYPEDIDFKLAYGSVLAYQHKYNDAMTLFKEVLPFKSLGRGDIQLHLAVCYAALGQWDDVEALWNESKPWDRKFPHLYIFNDNVEGLLSHMGTLLQNSPKDFVSLIRLMEEEDCAALSSRPEAWAALQRQVAAVDWDSPNLSLRATDKAKLYDRCDMGDQLVSLLRNMDEIDREDIISRLSPKSRQFVKENVTAPWANEIGKAGSQ